MEKDIKSVDLDFNALREYRWTNDEGEEFPILSLLHLYKASGLLDILTEYYKDKPDEHPVCIENILCNLYTLKKVKKFIEEIWGRYNIDIDRDHHVFWLGDDHSRRNYTRKLRAAPSRSVNQDFLNYCPGIDDSLENDVLLFRIYEKDEEEGQDSEKQIEVEK